MTDMVPLEVQLYDDLDTLKETVRLAEDGDLERPLRVSEGDYLVLWPNNLRLGECSAGEIARIARVDPPRVRSDRLAKASASLDQTVRGSRKEIDQRDREEIQGRRK